ncbi:MAG TPA: glycosyltransferase family 4 protein [Acidimicrobiia bacterium]
MDLERSLLRRSGFELEELDFHNPSSNLATAAALVRSSSNRSASRRVVERAREFEADVVHIHNTWFALSPAVIRELHGHRFPVVMTFHNYRLVCANAMLFRDGRPCEDCVGGSPLPGVVHRCYRNSFLSSAMVAVTIETHRRRSTWSEHLSAAIALTEFARTRLLQGGLPLERTVVKPNFAIDPGPRSNLASASKRVLYVGRLSPEKGVVPLIEAWETAKLQDLELVIVGSGPQADEARARAGASVRLVGRLTPDEVRYEMLRARALVVPSISYEGQPTVILEALAAGLPVWCTERGALRETAGPGGISLGDGRMTTLADALQGLTDDELLDRVGVAARREFEHRYTPEKAIEALRQIYSTVA